MSIDGAVRGFTLIELLIVLVLIGVMSGMAVLAIGQADTGRNQQLEAERLVRLLELAEQEATINGEIMAVEFLADGYRFLQAHDHRWQLVSEDALFQAHHIQAPLHLDLFMDSKAKSLSIGPGNQPQPQVVLMPEGNTDDIRLVIGDANHQSRTWVINSESGWQVLSDDAAERLPR